VFIWPNRGHRIASVRSLSAGWPVALTRTLRAKRPITRFAVHLSLRRVENDLPRRKLREAMIIFLSDMRGKLPPNRPLG